MRSPTSELIRINRNINCIEIFNTYRKKLFRIFSLTTCSKLIEIGQMRPFFYINNNTFSSPICGDLYCKGQIFIFQFHQNLCIYRAISVLSIGRFCFSKPLHGRSLNVVDFCNYYGSFTLLPFYCWSVSRFILTRWPPAREFYLFCSESWDSLKYITPITFNSRKILHRICVF